MPRQLRAARSFAEEVRTAWPPSRETCCSMSEVTRALAHTDSRYLQERLWSALRRHQRAKSSAKRGMRGGWHPASEVI